MKQLWEASGNKIAALRILWLVIRNNSTAAQLQYILFQYSILCYIFQELEKNQSKLCEENTTNAKNKAIGIWCLDFKMLFTENEALFDKTDDLQKPNASHFIFSGDEIVSVDGISVKNKTHKEAMQILHSSDQRVNLEIEKGNMNSIGETTSDLNKKV